VRARLGATSAPPLGPSAKAHVAEARAAEVRAAAAYAAEARGRGARRAQLTAERVGVGISHNSAHFHENAIRQGFTVRLSVGQ
jgi:hypothetical protein